jgi:hypothetical protein
MVMQSRRRTMMRAFKARCDVAHHRDIARP